MDLSICLSLLQETPVCSVAQVIHFMLHDQRKFLGHITSNRFVRYFICLWQYHLSNASFVFVVPVFYFLKGFDSRLIRTTCSLIKAVTYDQFTCLIRNLSDGPIVYHFAENAGRPDGFIGDGRNSIHLYRINYPPPEGNYFSILQCFSFPLFYYISFSPCCVSY